MRVEQPVYIFSVERADASASENDAARRYALAIFKQRRIPYKLLTGVYAGEREQSYLVPDTDAATVFQLARWYQQESVLYLDANRNAQLIYLAGGPSEELGPWREINPNGALPEAYTVDHASGKVWAAG